uniref:Kinase n=1 Tax=Haptolina brevifila TaxID=156173 RepID=A0A7S2FPM2_9EUKA
MGLVMGCRTIIPTGTAQENLEHLDHMTSTATLGFRIDAARTVVNGALEALPLPDDKTLDTLKEEDDIIKALGTFFQHDTNVCKAALMKLESIAGAIERSAFAAKHVLLRSSLLMLFDDDKRDHVELKMINFGFSYALPEGSPPAGHTAAWDGTATSHEDGYLTGARSLVRLMKRLHKDLEIRM